MEKRIEEIRVSQKDCINIIPEINIIFKAATHISCKSFDFFSK